MAEKKPIVKCPMCRDKIFDGTLIRAKITRVLPSNEVECLCKQCNSKEWVKVPLVYKLQSA